MTKEEDNAIGCLFYIAIAFVIIGVVAAFGAYGMIGIGVTMLAIIFYGFYKAVQNEKTS